MTFLQKLAEKCEKWTERIFCGNDFWFENNLDWSFSWKKVVAIPYVFPAGRMTKLCSRRYKQNQQADLPKLYTNTFGPIDSAPVVCIVTFLSFTEVVKLSFVWWVRHNWSLVEFLYSIAKMCQLQSKCFSLKNSKISKIIQI